MRTKFLRQFFLLFYDPACPSRDCSLSGRPTDGVRAAAREEAPTRPRVPPRGLLHRRCGGLPLCSTKVIARYGRCDLLCLDEFGYLELDKTGAKLLFQIFTDREERRAMAVASNAPFSEWKRTFTDPRLCAAIVDRLTYNAHIIETGTQSFRLAQTRARAENG